MKCTTRTAVSLLIVLFSIVGCLESRFQLSSESRLPKWFAVDNEMRREDLLVHMELHSTFSGGKAVFTLSQKNKLFHIQEYTITSEEQPGIRSEQLKSPPDGSPKGYPRYKVVTINGITDIIELRKMEPFFYMSDDPAVWKEFGVKR